MSSNSFFNFSLLILIVLFIIFTGVFYKYPYLNIFPALCIFLSFNESFYLSLTSVIFIGIITDIFAPFEMFLFTITGIIVFSFTRPFIKLVFNKTSFINILFYLAIGTVYVVALKLTTIIHNINFSFNSKYLIFSSTFTTLYTMILFTISKKINEMADYVS